MIEFENTEVYGWESAIRGMRNPMNSWENSDSCFCFHEPDCEAACEMHLGPNDLKRMKSLIKAGPDHAKFMRMINVTVDITAPLYWWKEFDTYKVGTVRNSCSTMHKIHEKEFELDDFSHEHLVDDFMPDKQLSDKVKYFCDAHGMLILIIRNLNGLRENYLATNDKEYWYSMIQLLPSSYNQRATVQLNYQVLRNMYHGRKAHKLDEWREGFCAWVKSLPYSELITE